MKKPLPPMNSDEEAERFVDEADLSEYDLSGGRIVHFDLRPPADYHRVTTLLSSADLEVATQRALGSDQPLEAYLGGLVHALLERPQS